MANGNFDNDVISTFGQNNNGTPRLSDEHPAEQVFSLQFKKEGSCKVNAKLVRYWDRDSNQYGAPVFTMTASQPGRDQQTQWVQLPTKSEDIEELSQWLHKVAEATRGAPVRETARVDEDFGALKAEVAKIKAAYDIPGKK